MHLEPKGPVQVNGKSDKKCIFCANFALRKKIGSITFSQFYICLNLARDLHINVNNAQTTLNNIGEADKI